jgi:beta-glucosidase
MASTSQAKFVWHEPGVKADYSDAIRKADLIIAVLGLTSELEGEDMPIDVPGFRGGDRTTLDLPQVQRELLEGLVASGKPVVLVLVAGSALGVNWANEHVPAILEAWYPGEEGGTAVAEALAGDFSPSGKLPVTFYRSVDQLPPFEDYDMKGRTYRYFTGEPLYPFGYGLSYTKFAFSNLTFDKNALGATDDLTATVDVKNTGEMASNEVVELYVAHPGIDGAPIRSLAGISRVSLNPRETKSVTIQVPNRNLSVVTPDGTRRIVPGELQVWVGDGQPVARAGLSKYAGITGSVIIHGSMILPK